MSAKKYPAWLPPVSFVAVLTLALILSNLPAPSPLGGDAITNDMEYQNAQRKGEDLSKDALVKYETGVPLSNDDKKKLSEAALLYDKITTFAPTVSPLLFLSGKIHHILGEDALAEERFRQCTLMFVGDAQNRPQFAEGIRKTGAEAGYQLAQLLVNQPNKQAALDAANLALSYVPGSSDYHTVKGSILNEMRRTNEAKAELRTAIQLDPDKKNQRARSLLKFISE